MEFVHVLSILVAAVLIRSSSPRPGNGDTCNFDFQVWQPNNDMVTRMELLETKYANVSNYLDKELFKLRLEGSTDLHRFHNWTMALERSIVRLQTRQMSEEVDMKELGESLREFENKVTKFGSKVDDFILHFSNRKPKSLRRKHSRKDRTLASSESDGTTDFYFVEVLKNMVSDLNSEWILMKRDLLDLRSRTDTIQQGNDKQSNATVQLGLTVDSVMERCKLLRSSDFKQSSDLENIKSNLASLQHDLASLKTIQEKTSDEALTSGNGVAALQSKTLALQRDVKQLQGENEILRRRLKSDGRVNDIDSDNHANNIEMLPLGDASRVTEAKVDSFMTPTDCHDVYAMGHCTSAVYPVKVSDSHQLDDVYCQMINETGYTLIQRRTDGLLSFNRGWLEYKVGFGNLYGDFWIGNDIIHALTNHSRYTLRVDLWDWEGNMYYAEYSIFSVESETNGYTLHVSGFSGNAGDSLSYHDKMKFSTKDVDNDLHMRNCAAENNSGWWYNSCYFSQLNGVYHVGWYPQSQSTFADGVVWYTLKDSERYSIRKVEVKLRKNI